MELLITVTALVTSISSTAIAVHHGRIMERLAQANSVPYMQGGFSDFLSEGERVLSLDLLNRGVGPAQARRYCSVFDDCREVLGKWEEPRPVEACLRDEAREFMP